MNQLRHCIAVGTPATGLCVLTVMYLVIPIASGGGLEGVGFCLSTIQILTVPMTVWLPLAFMSYGFGLSLFRIYVKGNHRLTMLIVSEVVMCVPLCITALLFSAGEYHGP
ncbi:MAG: hypothetical protein HN742_04020 [Lentisphaerae bacterium]|jgi:hypothetical protein|nr:hypothetical protein [Lentisphaerota bacterium]MBT4819990.1 hypothetical protein [Lentisphaerota bacterium]MBT5604868.1 hypothetical protein [Lentisphaerota bacterium]MBT7054213.1 hypothetical protein [Lentisphaerota bacterium]MBT7841010.1 hypothetical protein [Lentisphaerota bacterium]